MRSTRLIASLVTTGLLGVTPLAVGAPAQATDNLTTTSTLTSTKPVTVHGEQISLSGGVAASDGSSAYRGTATLYVMTTVEAAWTPVETQTSSGYLSFYVKPSMNSVYKVVYSGYTAANAYEDTYAPSESAPVAVGVQRKVTPKIKGLTVSGKVAPDYKRKKVVIKRKVGNAYRSYKTLRTNTRGVFSFRAPSRAGFKFSVTIPADKHFAGWTGKYYVY